MTNKEILELAEQHFDYQGGWIAYSKEDLLEFARAIRKQTIDEILTSLKEVPNPEANRTAINRIMSI
jgi:hypothetical protein